MSRIPAEESFDIVQGSTLSEEWAFFDDADEQEPADFTDVTAELRFAKDSETPPFLVLHSHTGLGVPITTGDRLQFTAGVLLIYITDETTAALTEAQFATMADCEGESPYRGRNTMLFTNATGETTVENVGEVIFTPIVEPAP